MLISGYGAGTSLAPRLRVLQDQMGDLQRQLSTGKVSRDFAGLGAGRDISLTMRAQLSKSNAFSQTISFVSGRLEATQLVLSRVESILNDTATGTLETNVQLTSEGQTVQQMMAERRFEETLALMNTEYEDRRLFGGRRMDKSTNIGPDAILNGQSGKDGLLNVIAERKLADTNNGTSATGRLAVGGAGTTASVTNDATTTDFGLKVVDGSQAVQAGSGIVASGAAGTLDFTIPAGNVDIGAFVSFEVALPDGTSQTVKLEAVSDAPPSAYGDPEKGYLKVGDSVAHADLPNDVKGFIIGATDADTAANLRVAIEGALVELAAEKMPNASAIKAAEDFFAYDEASKDPRRIDTTTWTGYLAPDPTSTVVWYTGEVAADSGDKARGSAIAKIDDNLEVSYGARANEDLFKDTLAALAVFSTEAFTVDDHANRERYTDLADRIRSAVAGETTGQRSRAMQADFASVQVAVDEARQRHRFRDVLAEDMVDNVEGIDDNLVATQLLAMQTQLQMSFQTTAMLSRMSLANVL